VLGRGLWSEMRENAQYGAKDGHGLDLLAKNLSALDATLKQHQRSLELHLVGHSAGSILLGHLLERAMKPDLKSVVPKVQTCSLFAAACSMRFAVETYIRAADHKLMDLERLWLHYLSDANEKRDGLPTPRLAAYGKSLLYLVSRALDDERKMPLLGMERAIMAGYENDSDQWEAGELAFVQAWQSRWKPQVASQSLARPVTSPSIQTTKAGGQAQATHGSFDNNVETLTETIERIKGSPLASEVEWLDY
jgi:pimeloyl-ACP methyl ester carboxylesterase